MRKERFLKKVAKLGLEPVEGYNGKWHVQVDNTVASWRYQNAWGDVDGRYQELEGVQEACSFHTRHVNDHSDIMTDYFAGSFCDNATQMLNRLVPPKPKFAVGSLVRGKDNKRANRMGYAGKVGLVIQAGEYMMIDWVGEERPRHNTSYPQRDIELVSAAA